MELPVDPRIRSTIIDAVFTAAPTAPSTITAPTLVAIVPATAASIAASATATNAVVVCADDRGNVPACYTVGFIVRIIQHKWWRLIVVGET